MDTIYQFISAHQAPVALGSFWIFSALVSGMPAPTTTSSMGYTWLYNSLHILSSNLDKVFAKRVDAAVPPEVKP